MHVGEDVDKFDGRVLRDDPNNLGCDELAHRGSDFNLCRESDDLGRSDDLGDAPCVISIGRRTEL